MTGWQRSSGPPEMCSSRLFYHAEIKMTTPPNIIFIQTDQHRYDCIAGHGHPLVRTPNLDRLIREGATFSHAFCASPVCRPARASLMTGVWPTCHGVICNENLEATAVLRPGLPTWSEVLAGRVGRGYPPLLPGLRRQMAGGSGSRPDAVRLPGLCPKQQLQSVAEGARPGADPADERLLGRGGWRNHTGAIAAGLGRGRDAPPAPEGQPRGSALLPPLGHRRATPAERRP